MLSLAVLTFVVVPLVDADDAVVVGAIVTGGAVVVVCSCPMDDLL